MYLHKLNEKWLAYLHGCGIAEQVSITNTTKLGVHKGAYMIELQYNGNRYHLYHTLGQSDYELHVLNEAYGLVRLEDVFGKDAGHSASWMKLIEGFMRDNYAGVQTSVDCSGGIKQAKETIRNARLK